VWTLSEIKEMLGEDAEAFAKYYGIIKEGNFEHGKNVLYIANPSDALLKNLPSLKAKLLKIRAKRSRPLRDEKVLTSWNGLMLGAMASAGDLLEEPRFFDAARSAGEFIWKTLRPNGLLLHRWHDGDEHSSAEARFAASLDDFAFLIQGYLDLYEATFDIQWLESAMELQEEQDSALYDTQGNGYFNTREAPDLILRVKNDYDGAEPSGNSVSVRNLFRLSAFTENNKYQKRAEEIVHAFTNRIGTHPFVMPALVAAAFWSLRSPMQIVFAGEDFTTLKQIANSKYLPVSVKMLASQSIGEFAKSLVPKESNSTAYVCHDFKCELPVAEPLELERMLTRGTALTNAV
jgi:uncharacterized protein